MSQYTISLRAYINLYDEFTNNHAAFADVAAKIELGRKVFFNFDYEADATFKEFFERAFLLHNFDNDIYCNDIDIFKARLENDVKIRIPEYYKMWKDINTKYSLLQSGSYFDTGETEEKADTANKSNVNSKNKTLGSQFPRDIDNSNEFDDVEYMDSGTMGESESDSTGESNMSRNVKNTVSHIDYGDIMKKLQDLERQSLDVINVAVKTFDNLFMGVW